MKSNTIWKLSTLAFAGLAAFAFASTKISEARAGGPEGPCANQPHMKAALAALETAKGELKSAEHDKGGWRVAAVKHTENAIAETLKGCQHDNKH
jgi:hypothetical protein